MAIFLFAGICNIKTLQIGSARIKKSETTLTAAVAMKALFTSTQCPGVLCFHIFLLGVHAQISTTVSAK